jgi:hypothetical protein
MYTGIAYNIYILKKQELEDNTAAPPITSGQRPNVKKSLGAKQ